MFSFNTFDPINMPVFGNRMVVGTANVKHIAKVKKETEDRENRLAQWMREKQERKDNLKRLHDGIRQNSLHSGDFRMPDLPDGELKPDSRRGSSSTAGSGSRRNSSNNNVRRDSRLKVEESVGGGPPKRSPSSATLRSSGAAIVVPDTTQIVGGGRKKESPCANCCIQ